MSHAHPEIVTENLYEDEMYFICDLYGNLQIGKLVNVEFQQHSFTIEKQRKNGGCSYHRYLLKQHAFIHINPN